jgi:hypothetical protein
VIFSSGEKDDKIRFILQGEVDLIRSKSYTEVAKKVQSIVIETVNKGMNLGSYNLSKYILDSYATQTIVTNLNSVYISPN